MHAQGIRGEQQIESIGPTHAPPDLPTGLLNELCEQVLGAYSAVPHGGLEIGMILFGRRMGQRIRVQGWRPIPCSHLLGPRFILAAADEALIPEVLSTPDRDPALAGTEPVGWCCSHTRSELAVLDREVDFHERYFRKPGDFALLLKPRSPLKAEAAVFERNADGRIGEPVLTVELPVAHGPADAPTLTVAVKAVGESHSILDREPANHTTNSAEGAMADPLPPAREALITRVRNWQAQRIGVLACLMVILIVVVYALVREYPHPVVRPPTLSVTLKPTAVGLALVWKSNLPEGSSAQAQIKDANGVRDLDLTGSFEPTGVLLFPHQPGNVQTVLSVRSGGRTYTQQASYSDRVKTQPVVPGIPTPAAVPVVSPAKTAKRPSRHHRSHSQAEPVVRPEPFKNW